MYKLCENKQISIKEYLSLSRNIISIKRELMDPEKDTNREYVDEEFKFKYDCCFRWLSQDSRQKILENFSEFILTKINNQSRSKDVLNDIISKREKGCLSLGKIGKKFHEGCKCHKVNDYTSREKMIFVCIIRLGTYIDSNDYNINDLKENTWILLLLITELKKTNKVNSRAWHHYVYFDSCSWICNILFFIKILLKSCIAVDFNDGILQIYLLCENLVIGQLQSHNLLSDISEFHNKDFMLTLFEHESALKHVLEELSRDDRINTLMMDQFGASEELNKKMSCSGSFAGELVYYKGLNKYRKSVIECIRSIIFPTKE